ncbi:MAG: DnaD domain-containing protein [Culicoidibacterales bacterium]
MDKQLALTLIKNGSISVSRLLIQYYHKLGMSEAELVFLLQIFDFASDANYYPSHQELAIRMGKSVEECLQYMRNLMQKNLLTIETKTYGGIIQESYDVSHLYERLYAQLFEVIDEQVEAEKQVQSKQTIADCVALFEQEFGRPLSGMEMEMIGHWADDFSAAMLIEALREAVLSNVLNFRYIDKILLEWQKKKFVSVEQVQAQRLHHQRHNRNQEQEPVQPQTDFYYYDWLAEEE